MREVTGYLKLE